MTTENLIPFELFDAGRDVLIVERRLPHWSQTGTICFITFRSHDSMPKHVLRAWYAERENWLRAHDIDPNDANWREALSRMDSESARTFLDDFWNRWHDALDVGHGACVLRQPELSSIVARSLHHFDGDRYRLLDFVVMPNHVHVLCSFPDEESMLSQRESWKHFTATQINRRLGRKGRFWQRDGFDHLIRSEDQFQYLRQYIADNPRKARLDNGEFVHFSASLP